MPTIRRSENPWRSSPSTFAAPLSQRAKKRSDKSKMATAPAPADQGPPPPSAQAPRHPVAQMQGAFEESMTETMDESYSSSAKNPYLNADKVQRRKLLLESAKYERTVGGKWIQRHGENFHPLWKLVAQISFGMHLLQSHLAKSDREVIDILQSHVDEVDGFLERTTEDFDLAQHDINERIKYLRLPLEHGEVFDAMLGDRAFRTAIVDGNEKIEHIVARTTIAMKDALKDVQKGLDGTRELARFLIDLDKRWPTRSEEHEAVFNAMMGNTEGWETAYKTIQQRGNELGKNLVQLGGVISEIQRRAGVASRRNLPMNQPSSVYSPSNSSFHPTKRHSRVATHTPSHLPSQPPSQPSHSSRPSQSSTNNERPSNRVSTSGPSPLAPSPPSRTPAIQQHQQQQQQQQQQRTRTPKGSIQATPLSMGPIQEQDTQQSNLYLGQYPAQAQRPLVDSFHEASQTILAELPADTVTFKPRLSIQAQMTADMVAKIPTNRSMSASASQKSVRLTLSGDKESEMAGKRQSAIESQSGQATRRESQVEVFGPQHIKDDKQKAANSFYRTLDPAQDTEGPDDGATSFTKLHDDIIGSLEPQENETERADTASQASAPNELNKSPQLEGQTYFGYTSSDADTGSIDARSTPGKGRSRSTTNSQGQAPHLSKTFYPPEQGTPDNERSNPMEDEEGLVNHKHPIFQDIRSRDVLRSGGDSATSPQAPRGLSIRASNESLTSEARRNSFRTSDSSIKPAVKSETTSPIEPGSQAAGLEAAGLEVVDLEAATSSSPPGSASAVADGDGSNETSTTRETGLVVRNGNKNESRTRMHVGQAPAIMPAPIQTSFGSKDENGENRSPSPDIKALTSATIIDLDSGDPFGPYTSTPSSATRPKHPALVDRINGKLQEKAIKEAENQASSSGKHTRSTSRNQKKSPPETVHQPTAQSGPVMATTTTTTTSVLDESGNPQHSTSVASDGTDYTQTTSITIPVVTPPTQSEQGRRRALSPFNMSRAVSNRIRDPTPDKNTDRSKEKFKKFFSMRGKKEPSGNS